MPALDNGLCLGQYKVRVYAETIGEIMPVHIHIRTVLLEEVGRKRHETNDITRDLDRLFHALMVLQSRLVNFAPSLAS